MGGSLVLRARRQRRAGRGAAVNRQAWATPIDDGSPGEAMTAKMYSEDGFTPRKVSLAIMKGRR